MDILIINVPYAHESETTEEQIIMIMNTGDCMSYYLQYLQSDTYILLDYLVLWRIEPFSRSLKE